MNVGNGERFAKELYKNFNLKVMPGKYLSEGKKIIQEKLLLEFL